MRDQGWLSMDVGVRTVPSLFSQGITTARVCKCLRLIMSTFCRLRERWDGSIGTGVPDDESYRPKAVPMPPPFEQCRVVRVACGALHTVIPFPPPLPSLPRATLFPCSQGLTCGLNGAHGGGGFFADLRCGLWHPGTPKSPTVSQNPGKLSRTY